MMRSLWTSKTGMEAQQLQLDVVSHNLANVSTTGFKRSYAVFEDLMYQTVRQPGAASTDQTQLPTGLQVGLGVRPVATARTYTQGGFQQTSNTFDVAINGNGFFQIQMPDGTTGYSRNGAFQIDAQGQMVTTEGYLLQPQITVPANAIKTTIGADGTVTATVPGQKLPQSIGQIQLANFVNPAGLDAKGGNLYTETAASGQPTTGNPGSNGIGSVMQGSLEISNVNVVEELVQMIQTQRAYEMNSKAITTSDQMLQKLTQM